MESLKLTLRNSSEELNFGTRINLIGVRFRVLTASGLDNHVKWCNHSTSDSLAPTLNSQSRRCSRNPLALELTGGGSCSSAAAAAAQSSTFQTAARCQSCQKIESSHPDSCCFTPASAHQRERAWRADVLTTVSAVGATEAAACRESLAWFQYDSVPLPANTATS